MSFSNTHGPYYIINRSTRESLKYPANQNEAITQAKQIGGTQNQEFYTQNQEFYIVPVSTNTVRLTCGNGNNLDLGCINGKKPDEPIVTSIASGTNDMEFTLQGVQRGIFIIRFANSRNISVGLDGNDISSKVVSCNYNDDNSNQNWLIVQPLIQSNL